MHGRLPGQVLQQHLHPLPIREFERHHLEAVAAAAAAAAAAVAVVVVDVVLLLLAVFPRGALLSLRCRRGRILLL